MSGFLLILVAATAIVIILVLRPGANLRAEFDRRRLALTSGGNSEGDLIDFCSSDRGELQKDGTLTLLPWLTALSDYRDFRGRRAPTKGEAVYHRPDGPFASGRVRLTSAHFNEAERRQGNRQMMELQPPCFGLMRYLRHA